MRAFYVSLLFLLGSLPALAGEPLIRTWPRWRGPEDLGSTKSGKYTAEFNNAKNVLWKVNLPGIGCSTPAVWGEQILVTCPAEGQDTVLCFNWKGEPQWQSPVGPARPGKHRNGSGSNSSPVTDGRYAFAYFRSGNLAGLDLEGKVLWKTNLQERFAKDTLYWDIGTSPVVTDKAVVVAVMHSGESYLAAFEKATGDLLWKVSRNYETPVEGDHSYTTPIVLRRGGVETILVWGAERLTEHSAEDGRVLWSCEGFNPRKNANWVAVSSAVVAGDMAMVSFARGSQFAGVRLTGKGNVTAEGWAWTREDTGSFVPTPLVYDGKVYLVRDEGEVECLDPATGKKLWSDRFPKNRNKFYASPVIAGGKLYAPREDGVVFVADITDQFKLLAENDMQERIIASPVPIGDKLLIRGEQHLFCIAE